MAVHECPYEEESLRQTVTRKPDQPTLILRALNR